MHIYNAKYAFFIYKKLCQFFICIAKVKIVNGLLNGRSSFSFPKLPQNFMSNVNLSVVNIECFALVFTLCNPSDLTNTPYCITCALLFFGVGRLPCFCCAASLNTEWAFPLPFFCTVMILQIWLCWLLWTAVPDGTSNLLKIKKLIYYSPMDLCCYPVWIYSKSNFSPHRKAFCRYEWPRRREKRWTKQFVYVCLSVFVL